MLELLNYYKDNDFLQVVYCRSNKIFIGSDGHYIDYWLSSCIEKWVENSKEYWSYCMVIEKIINYA